MCTHSECVNTIARKRVNTMCVSEATKRLIYLLDDISKLTL